MKHRGVIYCATNHIAYFESALISAIALRHLNPDLPITILGDAPLYDGLPLHQYGITTITLTSTQWGETAGAFLSRCIKTRLNQFSPYEETLYLDADILPVKSIAPIWDYLSGYDMAMAHDRLPTIGECDHIAVTEKNYTLQALGASTTQFNSGVILWRNNPATQALFQHWQQEWLHFQKQDQLALVRALATTQVSVGVIPRNYNVSLRDAAPSLLPNNQVYLLHCWGGQVASGEFRQTAQRFHPEVVAQVAEFELGAA